MTDYSTKEWLTEDNRTLLTWMYEELYAFIPPKIGFTSWIFIEKLTNQVIGDGGYKGNPDTRGQIEIGYEIIESKRQKGYATEAIEALLEWTLTQDEVKSIIAKCHYKNIPSQSLLDKLGFKLIGEEDEMDLYQIKLEENSFLSISKYVMTGIITACIIIPIAKPITLPPSLLIKQSILLCSHSLLRFSQHLCIYLCGFDTGMS